MPTANGGRSSHGRALHLALLLLAAVAAALGVIECFLVTSNPSTPTWVPLLFPALAAAYVCAGLLAWLRRPTNRLGAVMTIGGFAWLAAGLVNTAEPVLVAVGVVTATLPLAVVVHMLLLFPSGTVRDGVSRATVVCAYVVAVVLQAPLYLFAAAAPPYDVLVVAARPDLAATGRWVQQVAGAAVMVVTAVVLGRRLRAADARTRRRLTPVFTYGTLAVLSVPFRTNIAAPALDVDPRVLIAAQMAILAGVPLAFLVAVLRGGYARTGEVEQLWATLDSEEPGRAGLERALADALGDDSVRLVLHPSGRGQDADSGSPPTQSASPATSRASVDVRFAQRPIGVIDYDAALLADVDLVRSAGQVVAVEVERERLHAELLASEAALRRSRARILEAGDQERRRIARDLHDGLQAQLVLLALAAQRIATDPAGSASTRRAALELRERLDAAAGELRHLVHGMMPAPLVERGLFTAVRELVDHVPLPTTLELHGSEDRQPAPVETTAYFVVAEAIANAVKHADARRLSVRLDSRDDALTIDVWDDGAGGAASNGGAGLRSLSDRVDALGGVITVDSRHGAGTRVHAVLPCAS